MKLRYEMKRVFIKMSRQTFSNFTVYLTDQNQKIWMEYNIASSVANVLCYKIL